MRHILFAVTAFLLFSSHDMFLKLDGYFLQPTTQATIQLYNGTFERSDNVIARNRMIDVSLVGNGERFAVDTAQWREEGKTTILDFETGQPGTWVAGLSTYARNIEMDADAFNKYLEHDGVLDMIELRKQNNTLGEAAVEKYSKHVKTIFQVGDRRTDDWQANLGYPIEFVPLANPYSLHAGDELPVQLLWQGKPLANQLVYYGSDGDGHGHDHAAEHDHDAGDEDHHHHGTASGRTDADGKLSVKVANDGTWYLRTIHLVESAEAGLTHESNWATLTFAVDHAHSGDHDHAAAHDHDHDGDHAHAHGDDHEHGDEHEHGDGHEHIHANGDDHDHDHVDEGIAGLPANVFWIASLLLVGGLFFWFNRKG